VLARAADALWPLLVDPRGALVVVTTWTRSERDVRDRPHARPTASHRSSSAASTPPDHRRPGHLPPPAVVHSTSSLASSRPSTEAEVRSSVISSPVTSSPLDPLPTFLVRLLPCITRMLTSRWRTIAYRLPRSRRSSHHC